ncbi:MAG: FMN-binding negative transcriptional regulator [Opitutaceae bacterium]|nr:FMN-binding negative transcriptional regulator [Opitutaceae bacterium]
MYNPPHFEETRPEVLGDLMRAHPLGTLVTLGAAGLDANHIPFEFIATPTATAPHGTLHAHVARANAVWRDFDAARGALVIFQGPQAYITPTWYVETKPATGKVVPTWNYCVVHAHGPLIVHDDRAWLRAQVERLVRRHESTRPQPWAVADAPADYLEKQLAAIVGIEIPITRLTGKWKVSQNRSAADRGGVASGLETSSSPDAAAMARMIREPGR